MSEAKNTQEVELRAVLKPEQKELLTNLLSDKSEKPMSTQVIIDEYFCPNAVKTFAEIEMDSIGSYSLRLRKKMVNSITKIDMNTKVITQFGDHNAWNEHEISVNSFEEAQAILNSIGFKSYFRLNKTRFLYEFEGMSINIEDIENFGSIIEVEIITTKDDSENAKTKIRNFLATINVDEDQIVAKSVTNLIMKKLAHF